MKTNAFFPKQILSNWSIFIRNLSNIHLMNEIEKKHFPSFDIKIHIVINQK